MSDFEAALRHQRFFWRFIGIISCVLLVVFLIVAVGMATFMSRFIGK